MNEYKSAATLIGANQLIGYGNDQLTIKENLESKIKRFQTLVEEYQNILDKFVKNGVEALTIGELRDAMSY